MVRVKMQQHLHLEDVTIFGKRSREGYWVGT